MNFYICFVGWHVRKGALTLDLPFSTAPLYILGTGYNSGIWIHPRQKNKQYISDIAKYLPQHGPSVNCNYNDNPYETSACSWTYSIGYITKRTPAYVGHLRQLRKGYQRESIIPCGNISISWCSFIIIKLLQHCVSMCAISEIIHTDLYLSVAFAANRRIWVPSTYRRLSARLQ